MVKVLSFNDDYSISEIKDDKYSYWEFPILNKYLDAGWKIKDWKMRCTNNGVLWTFILEL